MGLLDFDFEKLMTNPSFQVGMGILANNKGSFGNAIGKGMMSGLGNIQIYKQDKAANEYSKTQQQYLRDKVDTERKKLEQQKKSRSAEIDSEMKMFKAIMPSVNMEVSDYGDGYDLMPVGTYSDMLPVANKEPKAPVQAPTINAEKARLYGFTPQDLEYISSLMSVNPEEAVREMRAIRQASRKAIPEARGKLAEFKAYQTMPPDQRSAYDAWRNAGKGQGVNVTVPIHNYGQPKEAVNDRGEGMLVRFADKDPNAPVVDTGYRPAASDTEQMTSGYANRMAAAEQIIENIGDAGNPDWGSHIAGGFGETARRLAMDPNQQKHRQAQEDWVRAKLRKESGAVIAADEMEREIAMYFPQVGDSKEVRAQKANSRRIAIDAMNKTAGSAMPRAQKSKTAPAVKKYNPSTGRIE